jgi:transcriptional regulator with XRE-family HTH domain
VDGNELGSFLKTRRAKVSPATVNLPAGGRRRVPGLRRDEVARLAGISIDYYTEIEQGRATHPSPQVLAALSRCLRLDYDEQAYLYGLAECAMPPVADPRASSSLLDLLNRLADTPAMIVTDLYQVLVQNPLAEALLGDQTQWANGFAYQWFTNPDVRRARPRPPLGDFCRRPAHRRDQPPWRRRIGRTRRAPDRIEQRVRRPVAPRRRAGTAPGA